MIVNNIITLLVIRLLVISTDVRSYSIPTFDRSYLPPYAPQLIDSDPRYTLIFNKLCSIYHCPNTIGSYSFENVTSDKSSKDEKFVRLELNQIDSRTQYLNNIKRQEFSQGLDMSIHPFMNERPITTTNLLSLLDSLLNLIGYKLHSSYYGNSLQPSERNSATNGGGRTLLDTLEHKKQSLHRYVNDIGTTQDNDLSISSAMKTIRRWTRATEVDITEVKIDQSMSVTKSSFESVVITEAPVSFTQYSVFQTTKTTPEKPQAGMISSVPTIELTPKPTFRSVTTTTTQLPNQFILKTPSTTPRAEVPEKYLQTTVMPIHSGLVEKMSELQQKFAQALDQLERKFYTATFEKLSSISPPDRRENGISFVESGLFLYLILTTLSLDMDENSREEIDKSLLLSAPDKDKVEIVKSILNSLPVSNDGLKFRWSSRLVLNGSQQVATDNAKVMQLRVSQLNGTEKPEQLMKILNRMVEDDSGGAMRNTFEEDELSEGAHAVLMNTVYVRARWRASPTLLNGTHAFRDAEGAPARSATMIRINDIMRYADLNEWDAEALEISYATPGLSLLLLVPRGRSLRLLSKRVSDVSLYSIINKMRFMRVAASLPIYTLRMTLLLPNKLEAIGISRLVDTSNATDSGGLRLSHAIQRLMFWAEAGRNAFKDDGIEWDSKPQLQMVVDRPYLFFVRWHNLTLMNGNFVL